MFHSAQWAGPPAILTGSCHARVRHSLTVPAGHDNSRACGWLRKGLAWLAAGAPSQGKTTKAAAKDSLGRFKRRPGSGAATAELLVDADQHSIDDIKEALQVLKKEGRSVHTTVFAPPGRLRSSKWAKFLKRHQISFHPVSRSNDEHCEPNDDAIHRAMSELPSYVKLVGVLASDGGFVDRMQQVQANGTSVVAFIPRKKLDVSAIYTMAALRVVTIGEKRSGSRVRATLMEDGNGTVAETAHAYISPADFDSKYHEVKAFFGHQAQGARSLIQFCAKFWFANSLGALVVYPPSLAVLAVHDLIRSGNVQTYNACFDSLAFVLPVLWSSASKAKKARFGSMAGHRVFMGGGPFALEDSPDLVEKVLMRLGYLDDAFNADAEEALFCFLNHSNNKHTLRKLGLLPTLGDTSQAIRSEMRHAFRSSFAIGQWGVVAAGPNPTLRKLLRKEGLISSMASTEELFEGMQAFAQRYGLKPMRTFNGLARRIQNHAERNPSCRSLIEIAP